MGLLLRSHRFKCFPNNFASVQDCLLAVEEKVGHRNIKTVSRMNKAVVVFLAGLASSHASNYKFDLYYKW